MIPCSSRSVRGRLFQVVLVSLRRRPGLRASRGRASDGTPDATVNRLRWVNQRPLVPFIVPSKYKLLDTLSRFLNAPFSNWNYPSFNTFRFVIHSTLHIRQNGVSCWQHLFRGLPRPQRRPLRVGRQLRLQGLGPSPEVHRPRAPHRLPLLPRQDLGGHARRGVYRHDLGQVGPRQPAPQDAALHRRLALGEGLRHGGHRAPPAARAAPAVHGRLAQGGRRQGPCALVQHALVPQG